MRCAFGLVACLQPELARNELEGGGPRGLPRSDVSVVVPASGVPLVAGDSGASALVETPWPLVAYMIAPPPLFASRQGKLTAYGLTPERVPPVVTTQQCIKELGEPNPGQSGCFLAHQDAWRRIVKAGRPGIVFEADFSAGNLDPDQVKAAIQEAAARPDDKTSLGGYGLTAVAYILTPRAAAQLLEKTEPLCAKVHLPVDVFLKEWCRTARCSYVEHGNMPPLSGLGIFQQDLSLSSMHGANYRSTGHYLATVGAVVGEPATLEWYVWYGKEICKAHFVAVSIMTGASALIAGIAITRRYKTSSKPL